MKNLQRYYASSLEELFTVVNNINLSYETADNCAFAPLWFRANSHNYYGIVSTLSRKEIDKQKCNINKTYSNTHLREDYRYQSFRAKCSHLVAATPEVKIEWQEVMRHQTVATRLLDWSETIMTALLFALEPFLDSRNEETLILKRSTITPVIWVLNPQKLNEYVYDCFCSQDRSGNYNYIYQAVKEFYPGEVRMYAPREFARQLGEELKHNKEIYFSIKENQITEPEIDRLICLASIEAERTAHSSQLYEMLESYAFNPFFYLLLRYYVDGIATAAGGLPPLAIINPYHNERIKVQHGTFSIMPNYYLTDTQKKLKKSLKIDYNDMSKQPLIYDCLSEIRITKPAVLAKELLSIGGRVKDNYPELERFAQLIETEKYYL